MTSKQDTRNAALNQRDSLTVSARAQKSLLICNRFLQGIEGWIANGGYGDAKGVVRPAGEAGDVSTAGCAIDGSTSVPRARDGRLRIAAYEPMRSEVDVHPLLNAAYERGWSVFLPCMVKDSAEQPARMVLFPIEQEQLTSERPAFLDHPAHPFLLEDLHAQGWREADPEQFDVAVIPLVAFDESLMRLGYGGGNYDRFLPRLRPECFVAGVAFEEQRVDHVPTELHDLPLPRIYTA